MALPASAEHAVQQAGRGEKADMAAVERRERPARRAGLGREQDARRLAVRGGTGQGIFDTVERNPAVGLLHGATRGNRIDPSRHVG